MTRMSDNYRFALVAEMHQRELLEEADRNRLARRVARRRPRLVSRVVHAGRALLR